MDKQPILQAIQAAGTQASLATAIGIHPTFVSQWAKNRRPVPAKWCIPIEEATGGVVTRYDLRPDIFGPAPAKEGEAA